MKLTSIKNLEVIGVNKLNAIKGGSTYSWGNKPVGGGSRPTRPTTLNAGNL